MYAVLLPWLVELADMCLDFCVESVSDIAVVNNFAIVAGVFFVFLLLTRLKVSLPMVFYLRRPLVFDITLGFDINGNSWPVWARHGISGLAASLKTPGRRRALDDGTHGKFMDVLFDRSAKKVPYERRLARLLPIPHSDECSLTAAD